MFEISRDKREKTTTLSVEYEGPWKVFSAHAPAPANSRPLLEGIGRGRFEVDTPKLVRSYFRIETPGKSFVLADRVLPMEGGYNFRDLGGYETSGGKRIRWGRLFRADDMSRLGESDLGYLESIPLRSVIDFRSENEQRTAPDRLPASLNGRYSLAIRPGSMMDFEPETGISSDDGGSVMRGMNIALVSNEEAIERYREFFSLILDESKLPLLFHCSAGKDRTGMAAALFLAALGADEETIMYDYMLSNALLEEKYAREKQSNPDIRLMYEVRGDFLRAGFDHIEKSYRSVGNFLLDELELDVVKLRDMFLEPTVDIPRGTQPQSA